MEAPRSSTYTAPMSTVKPIHINFIDNMLAMSPYETDPRKHFSTVTKASFKAINPVADKVLNKKSYVTGENQKVLVSRLAICKSAPSSNQNKKSIRPKHIEPEDYLKLEAYKKAKYSGMKTPKMTWH